MSDSLSPSQGRWLRNCFVGNTRTKKEERSRFERFISIYSKDAWYMQSVYLSETIIPGRGRQAEQKLWGCVVFSAGAASLTIQRPFPEIPACTCSQLFVRLLFLICSDLCDERWYMILFLLVLLFNEKKAVHMGQCEWKTITKQRNVNKCSQENTENGGWVVAWLEVMYRYILVFLYIEKRFILVLWLEFYGLINTFPSLSSNFLFTLVVQFVVPPKQTTVATSTEGKIKVSITSMNSGLRTNHMVNSASHNYLK